MLGDIFGFVFRALVYGQVFFWWWLYDQTWLRDKLSEIQVNIIMLGTLILTGFAVWGLEFSVSQYKTHIILIYLALYGFAYSVYSVRFGWLKSLSLMGLTVFFNSYYWEFILHASDLASAGRITPNMILQMVHLLPAWFFVKRFDFDKNEVLDQLTTGLIFSAIVAFVAFRYLTWDAFSDIVPHIYREGLKMGLYHLNRVVSLFVLLGVVTLAVEK